MSHLLEAKLLARECLELAIDLTPDGKAMLAPLDARATGVRLLHHLRSIQHELKFLAAELAEKQGGAT